MTRYSLEEVSALTDLPRRTVRYYIQIGLLDRPEGGGRGAFYTRAHLERLLAIRGWQRSGLSLERIGELVRGEAVDEPPRKARGPGTVEVWSHIVLEDGVELIVEPGRANLSPEMVRRLATEVEHTIRHIRSQS